MEFEFDPAKSETNLRKHQINFVDAQQLWTDQFATVADARSDSELRSTLIAAGTGEYGRLSLLSGKRKSG